jgi:hypothetical protein
VRRLEAFLYSRRNIAGSLLALGGLALHFVGLLAGVWWLPLVAGLYLIGYLLVPPEAELSIKLGAADDANEVRDGLAKLLRALRGKVADDLYAKVMSIQQSILGTLEIEHSMTDAADPNVYLIRQTALAYLPDAFSTYLRMPRATAERRPIAGGRTPHDVLLEQLDLMDRRLADVADDMARHDSDKLLANGRFLAEKFGASAFQLDTDAVTSEPSQSAQAEADPAPDTVAARTPESERAEEPGTERERVH